jgi:hypothetical protein
MRLIYWIVVFLLVGVLGTPQEAFAWGPATHVGLGNALLDQLTLLPGAMAALLARNKLAYLYGNVAADIVFAKRWSRVKQFCHHWSTGFRLLEESDDDRDRAFALGYLSHLAADTVAHGKYVPRQIVISKCAVNSGHFFWELRADAMEEEATWQSLEAVFRNDHDRHYDHLERQITGTFLSFDLNRLVFDGINTLAARRAFRQSIGAWNRRSQWYLAPELLEGYRVESLERIVSLLSDGAKSKLLREDPNGTSALMSLRVHRKGLRGLKRRGLPIDRRMFEATRGLAPKPLVLRSESPSDTASPEEQS